MEWRVDKLIQPSVNSLFDLVHTENYKNVLDMGWTNLEVFPTLYSDLILYQNTHNVHDFKTRMKDFGKVSNTEFFAGRDSDHLLIVVGESWTYGDTEVRKASVIPETPELFSRALTDTFAAKTAKALNCDLHQWGWPGQCTSYIFRRAEEILFYYKQNKTYKTITMILQVTEFYRDYVTYTATKNSLSADHHVIKLGDGILAKGSDPIEWLSFWEQGYIARAENLQQNNENCTILLWKNFNPWISTHSHVKIVDKFAIQVLSEINNHPYTECHITNALALSEESIFRQNTNMTDTFIIEQLNLIDRFQQDWAFSDQYSHHYPTSKGHTVLSDLFVNYLTLK